MTTLSEARKLLRDRLDESSPRRWQDDQLNAWINEGCRDITRRAEVLHAETDIAVLANVQNVGLSTVKGLLKLNRVEWHTTGQSSRFALEYRDFNNMDAVWFDQQSVTRSTPAFYTLKGTPPSITVVLYPTPSQAGTLRIHYWRASNDTVKDNDTLDLPTGWEDVALDYAEYKALRRDRDPEWQSAFQAYKDNLAAMVDTTRRFTDAATVITPDVGGSRLPAWLVDPGWSGY